jgi:hypothetical protein
LIFFYSVFEFNTSRDKIQPIANMAAATTSLTGKRVTIQTAGPDSIQFTGTVQEVVQLNGNVTILIREEDTFKLIDMKNIVTIEELQELGSETIVQAEAEAENHQCAICLEAIDMMQNAVSTRCGHQFHFTCLVQNMSTSSLQTRNQCPLCRSAIMQEHAVYRHEDAEQQLFENAVRSNYHLRNEVEIARRIRDELSHQFHQVNVLRERINHVHRAARQEALAMIDQAALNSNLYTRITGLVNSAANNDIRENYDDMHEIFEEEIRSVCFDFALMAVQTTAMQGAENEFGAENEVGAENEFGAENEVANILVQMNNRNEVIMIE